MSQQRNNHPRGTVSAGIPQTLAHLTPAQQQVNIAFPGALSSSQGLAQEEEEESPVVTQARQRFQRSQSQPPNGSPEDEVEPRGSRGGRRPGAGRPPGRGRGSGGRT